MADQKQYYVYVYRDPRPGKDLQPIYVGKGRAENRRAYFHWEKPDRTSPILGRVLAKIALMELEPIIEIVYETDDEGEAFEMERILIKQYGRRLDGSGSLCNLTIGGEGTAGLSWTEQQRTKIMEKLTSQAHSAASRTRLAALWKTPEHKSRMAEKLKERLKSTEFRARLRAAIIESRTAEVRARIGAASKARWQDPKHRASLLAARKATFAKPEKKAQRSRISKAMWADPEMHAKISSRIAASKSDPALRAKVGRKTKEYYSDPAKRAEAGAFAAAYNTPEVKARKAAEMKARWADPEFRAGRALDREMKLIREAIHARRPTHMESIHV